MIREKLGGACPRGSWRASSSPSGERSMRALGFRPRSRSRSRSPFHLSSESDGSSDRGRSPQRRPVSLSGRGRGQRTRRQAPSYKGRVCPICNRQYRNLSRHSLQVHGASVGSKRPVVKSVCPVQGCGKTIKKLRDHIVASHKIDRGSSVLSRLLEKARPANISAGESSGERSPSPTPPPIPLTSTPRGMCPRPEFRVSASEYIRNNFTGRQASSFKDLPILRQFNKWRVSPEVDKDFVQAGAQAKQIFTIWKSVRSGSDFKLNELMDADSILENWLTPFREAWQPGTVRSYLGSLASFCRFLLARSSFNTVAINNYLQRIGVWSRSLRKRSNIRQTEVAAQALENLITPNKISTVLSSTHVRNVEFLLNNPDIDNFNIEDFFNIRDYLMFRLILANGQRSGDLKNITGQEFATGVLTDAGLTVRERRHKTAQQGPATLYFSSQLVKFFNTYLTVRSSIAGLAPRSGYLFVDPNQPRTQMESNQVHRSLGRVWKLGGGRVTFPLPF